MREALRKVVRVELFRAGFWLTFASVLSGILGYIYQVVMGRLLSPGEFALLSAVMALAMFFAAPLNTILMLVSRKVSALRATGYASQTRKLYFDVHVYILFISLILLVFLWVYVDYATQWLNAQKDITAFLLFTMIVAFSMQAVNNGVIQGFKLFGWLGLLGLLAALLKLLISTTAVWKGFSVEGALAGVVMASAITWVVGAIFLNRVIPLRKTVACSAEANKYSVRSLFSVLAANIAFAVMTQLDMVLVNIFFEAESAGSYAAASVLGKAVLYLPGGLVLALFPLVADSHAQGRQARLLLVQAVSLTAAVCIFASSIYWFFHEEIILYIYGVRYADAAHLLKWYGFAVFPLALVLVAEHFLIAKGRVLFAWLFLVVAPFQLLAIVVWHEELWYVLVALAAGGGVLVILGYGVLMYEFKRSMISVD